jgi:uncharacterized membrane protein YuzA (DUF378 family)
MRFLTSLVYILVSLVAGALFISLFFNWIQVDVVSDYLKSVFLADYYFSSPRMFFFLVGVALILLCLRYVQAIFRSSRKSKSINFDSNEGTVSITLFAIEEMLKRMLEERREVSHVKPKVFLRRRRVEVVIRGILTAEVNLIEFTKEIQEAIKKKINVLLGEEKEIKVNLEIRKVALGKKGKVIEDKEPEVPFRHYE